MGFVWSEIKKWAKANGMEPTKSKDGLYHFDGQSHKDIEPIDRKSTRLNSSHT